MDPEIKASREKDVEIEASKNVYGLLSSVEMGQDLTLRDDQFDFPDMLDAVKICRGKGLRFRLVDTGRFDRFQLEWLLGAGADLYTSDDIPRDLQELEGLQKSCRNGSSLLAFFQHQECGSLNDAEPSVASKLLGLARSGIYLHISNREMKRDISLLRMLAEDCLASGSWLVYYHHGPLVAETEELGRGGAWIHLSDESIQSGEDQAVLMDLVKSCQSSGANLVLYLKRGMDYLVLQDVVGIGAVVLFKTSQIDYRSPLKELERAAARKIIDFRAFYLHLTFLP